MHLLNTFDEAKLVIQHTIQQVERLAAEGGHVIPYDRREVLRWGMERWAIEILDARDGIWDSIYEMMRYTNRGEQVLAVLTPSLMVDGYEVQDGLAVALDVLTLPDPTRFQDEISDPLEWLAPGEDVSRESVSRATYAGQVRFLRHVQMHGPQGEHPADPERLARWEVVQRLMAHRPAIRYPRHWKEGGLFGN